MSGQTQGQGQVQNNNMTGEIIAPGVQGQHRSGMIVEVERTGGWTAGHDGNGWVVIGMLLACLIAYVSFRVGRVTAR